MAGLLSKNKELLRLIPDLQCHDCKSVPGPNENQKNRYSCFDASHILCEEHKAKCPCGSKVKNFIKPARLFWTGPNHFVQVLLPPEARYIDYCSLPDYLYLYLHLYFYNVYN